jgi:hypothetical protein
VPPVSITRRVSAPSWRDPRFLVGLALVLASVVLGARVVGAAQETAGVWALSRAVGAGQPLTGADLRVVQVHLDEGTAAAYLPASETPAADLVALRGLASGELLPQSALGRAGDLASRPVTVPVAGNVPPGVEVGALVDLWVVHTADATGVEPDATPEAEPLVEAAEVSAVVTGGGALGARSGADVQVVLPQSAMPAVLQAVSDDDDIVLVPVPGGGRS